MSIQNGGISYVDVASNNVITEVTTSGGIGSDWEGLAWQDSDTLYGITEDGLLSEYSYDGSTLTL